MNSTANTPTKTQDQTQQGCCCGSSNGTPKSTTAETRKTAAAVVQDTDVKEIDADQPKGCCGGH